MAVIVIFVAITFLLFLVLVVKRREDFGITKGAKYGRGSDYDRIKQRRAIGQIRTDGESS
jgi:hypothetical protein